MRALHRAPKGGAFACPVLALIGALLVAPACGLNQEGVPPPKNRIGFPGSVKADPNGRWLYVVNSNADLRYNAGTVVAVDVDKAAADRADVLPGVTPVDRPAGWEVCPRADYIPPAGAAPSCCWDFLDHNILDCDERRYITSATTIEIGSFGAGSAFQSFPETAELCPAPAPATVTTRSACAPSCEVEKDRGRLYIGVRGNSSLTYVDTARAADGQAVLSCPEATSPGTAHNCAIQELEVDGDPIVVVPDEPYTLQLDRKRDLLYVGHLRGSVAQANTGGISLFDINHASERKPPVFIKPSGSIFPPDTNGNFGVTSLLMRNDRIFATSRFLPMATGVVVTAPMGPTCKPLDDEEFAVVPTTDTYVSPLLGAETRGIQFLPRRQPVGAPPTPARAFVLQRTPPAVVTFDSAMGEEGVFGNFPSEVIEVCQAPTFLQKDRNEEEEAAGLDDAMLYVTCFDQGQVYVIDPRVPRLVGIIDVGRGPAGLEFPRPKAGSAERIAYVVGFGSNNVSVIDLTPGTATQFHVIQRIGFPSVVPR